MVSCRSVASYRPSLALMKDRIQKDCTGVVSWKTHTLFISLVPELETATLVDQPKESLPGVHELRWSQNRHHKVIPPKMPIRSPKETPHFLSRTFTVDHNETRQLLKMEREDPVSLARD